MDTNLRKHQLIMFDALKEIDEICKKNKIKYYLFAGTALGAIRHKGFVPWDDDLDIIMPREDYEKFLTVAKNQLDNKYYLQSEFSEHWPMFYSKLRVNNTTCMERYYPKDSMMHQGIFIDIFPCDNLSDNKIIRGVQFISSKIVIAKSLDKRGYLTDSKMKILFMFVCKILPYKFFWNIAKMQNKKSTKMVHTFFAAASKYKKNIFTREWFEKFTEVEFEGEKFPISAYYDDMLKVIYGNYMVSPPGLDKSKKKHSLFIDTEKSYENYLDYQKQQTITEYTRSTR